MAFDLGTEQISNCSSSYARVGLTAVAFLQAEVPFLAEAYPFEVGSNMLLREDWSFTVENNRISGRIWDAAECGADPDYIAANAVWRELIAEKHAILERGIGPKVFTGETTVRGCSTRSREGWRGREAEGAENPSTTRRRTRESRACNAERRQGAS